MAIGTNEFDRTPPQTEDSAERGHVPKQKGSPEPATYGNLGQAGSPDDEDTGDIADEGPGHRG